jgi:tRNA A37 methylthiotransferase MiaB
MLTHFQQHDAVEQDNIIAKPMEKFKILFYHAGTVYGDVWLYPAVLQLKTHIDLFCPEIADRIEWLVPIQQQINNEELVKHIEQHDVDLLCTSHYLWNHAAVTEQLSSIRNRLQSKIKVIAGGPSIDANNNTNFFQQHPYIDYAVYGAGEQAFADIVKHLILDTPLIAFNTSNCVWKNQKTGKTIVADYKFVKMSEVSPFIHNEELLSAMTNELTKKNLPIWLPYSLTRGCAYSCTFCDWNSGLGNKVSRRKNTYQQEIDLFHKLGLKKIYLSDANVGQYDEDVQMIEYFAEKNLKNNADFHVGGNFSKLNKKNNLKIFHIMAQGKLIKKTLNFSIQDTNEQILENIDRPDVGWEVHRGMADELRQAYPHLIVKAQLIYGLPGQTPVTWQHTLEQITQHNILPIIFLNEPLPASPARYDPEYQRKFQYEYIHSNRLFSGKTYLSLIPKKSSSFDQADIVRMNVLSAIFYAVTTINLGLIENHLQPMDTSFVATNFLNSEHYRKFYNNLYYNWTVENNFYYTIDFDNNTVACPDLGLGQYFVQAPSFIKYIIQFINPDNQKEFSKLYLTSKFRNLLFEITHDVD